MFDYQFTLVETPHKGLFTVLLPDFPGICCIRKSKEDAFNSAVKQLSIKLQTLMANNNYLPKPSPNSFSSELKLPFVFKLKLTLYARLRAEGYSKRKLEGKLIDYFGFSKHDAEQVLDLSAPVNLDFLNYAFEVLGTTIVPFLSEAKPTT